MLINTYSKRKQNWAQGYVNSSGLFNCSGRSQILRLFSKCMMTGMLSEKMMNHAVAELLFSSNSPLEQNPIWGFIL